MSRTYSIVCPAAKLALWIGQSRTAGPPGMARFYSGEPRTMDRLGRFLIQTQGKGLVVLDDEDIDFSDYVEFEGPRDA